MVLREVSPDPREERQRRMESHCTGKNILNNIHSLNKKRKHRQQEEEVKTARFNLQ